jgi:TM2 domain-containing membrane protein YozV
MKESEFEKRFLEFVYRTDLAITPGALAYHAGIPIAEAEEHLKQLVTRDVVKLDVAANGDLEYTFPNRQRVEPERALALVPPRPVVVGDHVACPFCGEAILPVARKCKHCGELVDPALRMAVQPMIGMHPLVRPRHSQGVAALLSFFWPGAGHIYCGEVGAGVGWMMATFLGYILFIIPGLILHVCCIVAASNTAKGLS